MSQVEGFTDKVGFIWSVADLLRGDYKAHEYGQVILPLTVLRRLDCVLEPTEDAVVAKAECRARRGRPTGWRSSGARERLRRGPCCERGPSPGNGGGPLSVSGPAHWVVRSLARPHWGS